MSKKIFLFDHRDENFPGNLPIKYDIEQIKDILNEVPKEPKIELSILDAFDENDNNKIYIEIEKASLVLAHFEAEYIQNIINSREPMSNFPNRQVVVLITTQKPGFPANSEYTRHIRIQIGNRERIILFTMNMDSLEQKETLKKILTLSFEDAKKIVNGNSLEIFEDNRNDPFFVLNSQEILASVSLFCQGYLLSGLASGHISDEDVKTLIEWNDTIPKKYPALRYGWEDAINPRWWFPKGMHKKIDEFAKEDFIGARFPNTETLIENIAKGKNVDDYRIVKKALRELTEKKW